MPFDLLRAGSEGIPCYGSYLPDGLSTVLISPSTDALPAGTPRRRLVYNPHFVRGGLADTPA